MPCWRDNFQATILVNTHACFWLSDDIWKLLECFNEGLPKNITRSTNWSELFYCYMYVGVGGEGGLRSLNFQLPTPFRLWAFSIAKILCNVAIFFPIPVPATWRITLPILSFPTSCKLPPPFLPGSRPLSAPLPHWVLILLCSANNILDVPSVT